MNILDYFKEETGIDFHIKPDIMENKIELFCNKFNIKKEELFSLLKTNPQIKQQFINYFTTNETYFYREFQQIERLKNLIDKNKHIDILSIPSSSGEEPYSIAIFLVENNITNFKISGVDINSEMIQKAKKGIYKKNKLRNLPQHLIDKYFIKQNDEYMLNSYIKSFVNFKIINMFDKEFLYIGKFDFIFCRNLFIYFNKETKDKAKNILEKLKKDNNSIIFFGHADLF